MIYLDNAATTFPKPEIVYKTMNTFYRTLGANPGRSGHRMAVAAEKEIEDTRSVVAQLFGIKDSRRFIFTFNATDAINMGIKGLLKTGDHAITTHLEHNAVSRSLYSLEKKGIITITKVKNSPEGLIDPNDIKTAITSKTRLIVMAHAPNVLGTIQPIKEIGCIAREHDILFMVDAAQTAGVCEIDVNKYAIDMLAFTGHKGTLGPTGTGGLYVGERLTLDPWREGGTGFEPASLSQPEELPFKLESGTPNTVGIAGLRAGIEYIASTGIHTIRMHEQKLINKLIQALKDDQRFILYGTQEISKKVGILSLNVKGFKPAEIGAILDQSFDIAVRPGLHCAPFAHQMMGTFPNGTVRISPGCFTTEEEIDQLIAAFGQIASEEI
ncbi:MAG: aminotransferase class V-fold PLP-dependent enzyme [Candidatus Jettenia sp.]|uniref:cysteine desulfurase n=1 Tax=Candidatus Jettenia caeni TaxID=247490 RepID=I3IN99_9BACT|nr:aminotransferase class V-fold PLP-dependent enzyme [Candidatus Jettenia sp. AMX1]MBC6928075.1 aminotransferase class V-fold PLP-dependent enzyme [Candidatus Jettenia sp.]WKZ14874.1 MAG: aminotransferase class V-fold PLP-dependent enzyme [Candidatus Jettenia caeni]KAA0251176.1 MAG: aminotransferase class V-fold PLP-dependent enzyme [Candidatus Jettenia sp. AMX1]MCE7879284.1 aminotransferase class V-fold PLP-dependent enzyme [Candidatus Jettenia sp. AMX1]MDL1937910.1 aminotransferase class V-